MLNIKIKQEKINENNNNNVDEKQDNSKMDVDNKSDTENVDVNNVIITDIPKIGLKKRKSKLPVLEKSDDDRNVKKEMENYIENW